MIDTRCLPFVGRLFIGLPFMMSGLSKVANYASAIALIKSSTLPLPPDLAYGGAIAVEVGCGLLVILGYQTGIAATNFCLFCLATAVFFHFNFADPNQIFRFIRRPATSRHLRRGRAQHRQPAFEDARPYQRRGVGRLSRSSTWRARRDRWHSRGASSAAVFKREN